MKLTLLLGETQVELARAIVDYFELQNYSVQLETNGSTIFECLRQKEYNIVILEIALPGLDGIDIVKRFRSLGKSTPILLLTSEYSAEDFQDGYVVKPFRLDDLGAQVRAMLRRPNLQTNKLLASGNVRLNTDSGVVTKDDEIVHLHPMEYKLLRFLLSNPEQIFSPHALFERVWQKSGNLDTVRTHIRTLRQKLDSPGRDSVVTTVRGFGYKAEIQPEIIN